MNTKSIFLVVLFLAYSLTIQAQQSDTIKAPIKSTIRTNKSESKKDTSNLKNSHKNKIAKKGDTKNDKKCKINRNGPLILEYNFSRDSMSYQNSKRRYWVRERNGIEFKLTNINLLNYNVNINDSKEDYINEVIDISQSSKYNDIFSIELLNTQFLQEVNQVINLQMIAKQVITENQFSGIYKKNDDTKNNEEIRHEIEQRSKIIYDSIGNNTMQTENIKTKYLENAVFYYKTLMFILKSEKPIDSLINDRNNMTNFYYRSAIGRNGKDIRPYIAFTDVSSWKEESIKILRNKIANTQNILNEIKIIETISDDEKLKNNISAIYKARLQIVKSTLNELKDKYESVLSILTSPKIDEFATEIQRLYMSFDEYNHEVHIKEYNLENIDLVKLDITIEPKINTIGYKSRKEKFSTVIRTYNGLRFDVSAGLMFNFNLNDKSYFYDSSNFISDTIKIVRQKDRNTYLPFIGSQLNIYVNKPFKTPISPGFSIGVSTNLSDIRYYLGGCLAIGNKDRIVLSGGLVGGQINVLSGKFETDKIYLKKELPETPQVEKSFRLGGYFSITYNLSSPKAKSFGDGLTKGK